MYINLLQLFCSQPNRCVDTVMSPSHVTDHLGCLQSYVNRATYTKLIGAHCTVFATLYEGELRGALSQMNHATKTNKFSVTKNRLK